MKFGSNLPRNQVPEWSESYIGYKSLKKLIGKAVDAYNRGEGIDLAAFFFSLDRNLETVDHFYNKKYADISRRLKLLQERFGSSLQVPDGIDRSELEDLIGALLELRGELRKLQWYGEVNRRGFIKITKKLDKKLPNISLQRRYLVGKVDPKPFVSAEGIADAMKRINTWLSVLGDAKIPDDSASEHSGHSLHRMPSNTFTKIPATTLDNIEQSIRKDDAISLSRYIADLKELDDRNLDYQRLHLNFLQRSISLRALHCLDYLLSRVKTLFEDDDFNQRNCIHRLVISIGRSKAQQDAATNDHEQNFYITPAASPALTPFIVTKDLETDGLLSAEHQSVKVLNYLLNKLRPNQRSALLAKDANGRIPLHYAAEYGYFVVCDIIIKFMQEWGQYDVSDGIDSRKWQDNDGYAPLHLSVIGTHPLTTNLLLKSESWQSENQKAAIRKTVTKSSAVLALATKANSLAIVKLLVDAEVDLNFQEDGGETALHVAARFGHVECAKVLLEGTELQKANPNIPENTYGWTSLFIACVDGQLSIVEALIAAGADLGMKDNSGWTAKEHACLRGHIDIARLLAQHTPAVVSDPLAQIAKLGPNGPNPSLEDRTSQSAGNVTVPAKPMKTFGHPYLRDETMILVSLGSLDMRKSVQPVMLDEIPLSNIHATELDTALSLVVSASGATGEATIIDLPVQDNISTEPVVFTAKDASKVKLLFDIVPTYSGNHDRVVGRAVAMLASMKPSIGQKRISLQGDVCVPVVAATTLDVIGVVNFSFQIITPFNHPNMAITEKHTYWKRLALPMVIGHRGMGKNQTARKSLQLGENTIQSFITAANLGASYVEFDVQLTKDHVPVIYHDFLVSETGIDAPVHTLTLEQFLHINDGTKSRDYDSGDSSSTPGRSNNSRRTRSMSVNLSDQFVNDMKERMKHTRDYKMKGFKANSRGNFIQEPFTTLREMFQKLPSDIGFNIEMKYPMLFESEKEDMDTYAVELNSFVDAVLSIVYEFGTNRNIIFSSFHPDICLLLSFKQPSIPVLFLTDAGTAPTADIRTASIQEAIRFCGRWNLLGVVSSAEPFIMSPRLVRVVKESGLVCVSYGTFNNESVHVETQVKEGIDAVIVDNVLAIRKGLTASAASANSTSTTVVSTPLEEKTKLDLKV